MSRYEIIIYWSQDDNAYIAEVPELAGCMADGQTPSEVVKNVEKVIQEWPQNWAVPSPSQRAACAMREML